MPYTTDNKRELLRKYVLPREPLLIPKTEKAEVGQIATLGGKN